MKNVLKIIYPESWVYAVIFCLSLFATDNFFFLLIVISFLFYLKFTRSIFNSLWLLFISSMLSLRTLPFDINFIAPKLNINGDGSWYYSDLIFVLILYLILTRFNKSRIKVLFSQAGGIKADFFLFLFLAIAGYSTISASNPTISFLFYFLFAKSVILYLVSKLVFLDLNLVKKTMQIVIIYVVINSLLIIAQYLVGGPLGFDFEDVFMPFGKYAENYLFRPGGFTSDPNISASFIVAILPVAVVMFLPLLKNAAVYYWGIIVSIFLALIFTASRASWIITALAILPFLIYLKSNNFIFLPKKFKTLWVLGSIFLVLLIGPFIFSRILSLGQTFSQVGSGYYRIHQAVAGYRIMLNNPFGVGLGMFPYEVTKSVSNENSPAAFDLPHNLFIQLGAESGIAGLIIFLVFLYFLFKDKFINSMLTPNLFSGAMLISFVSMGLLMLAYPWLLHPRIGWIFWLLAGYSGRWKSY